MRPLLTAAEGPFVGYGAMVGGITLMIAGRR
jgi:hypothetical protein